MHGDDDRNVPFSQTTDLIQRLRQQNVEMEQIIFPDEIHDFLLWRTWVKGYKATAEFFDRKLKGASSPLARCRPFRVFTAELAYRATLLSCQRPFHLD